MDAPYASLEDLLGALGWLITCVPMPLIAALPIMVWLRKRDAARGGSDAHDAPGPDGSL